MNIQIVTSKIKEHQFLLEELIKRDFKKKYKRTALGMGWSILSPLLELLVMSLVFTQFFGRDTPHYIIYLFCGRLVFSFFTDATKGGMGTIMSNASIFTKVNVPKYLFLFSRNVQACINFLLILIIFFLFVAIDGIAFTWKFILLSYPICLLIIFNIGMGMILSAMFVFFRDTQYLYDIFTTLLMYFSAIFYTIDGYPIHIQPLFYLNPIFCFIQYFRLIVIDSVIPSLTLHGLILAYTGIVFGIGCWMYKKYNTKFLYYV
ncbi:MAG: ABC transporter permease [Eubacteriales bacterium]